MEYRLITDLELDRKNVLVRLDLNVPMNESTITDDSRIQAALPTLRYLLSKNCRIVAMSHLGRPKGADLKYSLEPVGKKLAELLEVEVLLVGGYDQEPVDQLLLSLNNKQMILLENLRFFPEEEENDREFARNLVKGSSLYVNDAFGTLHRAHASIVAAPEFISPENRGIGFLIQDEVEGLSKALTAPKHPYSVVLGGSKVSDKIGLILNLVNQCNDVLIGGAMAYAFLKHRGHTVGDSLLEGGQEHVIAAVYRSAEKKGVRIHLPEDHVCVKGDIAQKNSVVINSPDIPASIKGLDIGPKTRQKYREILEKSQTIVWNGPMGMFEVKGFEQGTYQVAMGVANSTGYSVVGGGDTVSAINQAGMAEKVSFVSTGGGASLTFLEGTKLPGLKVLEIEK